MPGTLSWEGIGDGVGLVWTLLQSGFWSLVDAARALVQATTADHLEGAAVMAAILLGPSFIIALMRGFWQGLRIEWHHYRGKPRVIDGDTLEIRGERIRLFGIDAPELGQPWWDGDGTERDAGAASRDALDALVAGQRLSVKVLREDQYRRSVAIVKIDGRDLARQLVRQGWAFSAPGSSRYRRSELSARRQGRGLWQGDLDKPWDYRATTT